MRDSHEFTGHIDAAGATPPYSGAPEKWQRQPSKQNPLFNGSREKSHAIFGTSDYKWQNSAPQSMALGKCLHVQPLLTSYPAKNFKNSKKIIIFYHK